ncbi:unnamed protein product [Sympodiomycopsis kandeliae]
MRAVSLFLSSLASVLLVSSSAYAQSLTASAPSSIPTGISTGCNSFLTTLNGDSSIKTCTAPLLSATQFYTNATKGDPDSSKDALQETLTQLCAADTGCDSSIIRQYLSQFWGQCMSEIKAKNKDVQDVYDVLYLINPFREAICSKDDDGNYCLTTVSTTATSSKRKRDALAALGPQYPSALEARQATTGQDATDSADTIDSGSFSGSNIAFLFLQPTAKKDQLCSTCAQNILASYIRFETSIPYAIGLSNSDILKGQSDLYKAGKKQCGDSWAKKVNQVAGTTDFAKVAAALSGAKGSMMAVGVVGLTVAGLTGMI